MFSSRQFIFFFFVLTTLLATGSARDLFLWARQNGQQDGNSGGNGNGGNNVAASTDATTDATTFSPTSEIQQSTESQQPTSTPQSVTPTSTPVSTTTPESTTTPQESSTTEAPTSTQATITQASQTEVVVIQTSIVSGSAVAVTHTTPASSQATNDLAKQKSSSDGGGMSQQQKSVAIGVGVGVGGAILLGALAIVAWRMWGRKKHNPEEDHFLMNDPLSEKPNTPSTAASPFKSTLDQYHNPAGRLNTSANF